MEKVKEQQDNVSSISGDQNTGIRSQAELEAEVEELNAMVKELQAEREVWQSEHSTYQEQLQSLQQSTVELSRQLQESKEYELSAHREVAAIRKAFTRAQQSQGAKQEAE